MIPGTVVLLHQLRHPSMSDTAIRTERRLVGQQGATPLAVPPYVDSRDT
ncbi:MAG: hypothetical protein VKJ46_00505 [Leptolyngbyaceae bacterium]|nr:hypothetical protein [Leptolyngbyaceae bacterium]